MSRNGKRRSRIISVNKITPEERVAWGKSSGRTFWRPKTRGECGTFRPCPFAGCRYHTFLDVNEGTGSIQLNCPNQDVGAAGPTCVLDVIDSKQGSSRAGMTLEEVEQLMELTRERVRQIESAAIEKIRDSEFGASILAEFLEDVGAHREAQEEIYYV